MCRFKYRNSGVYDLDHRYCCYHCHLDHRHLNYNQQLSSVIMITDDAFYGEDDSDYENGVYNALFKERKNK